MFDRPHHQRIARLLESLDAPLLRERQCLFGGGTAITLCHGEYRESVDVDFLVSAKEQYRELRNAMTGIGGVRSIMRSGAPVLEQVGELRADQYGIRTKLNVEGAPIKLEIVLEGRVVLETPSAQDVVCGVATLAPLDMAASKLLANSDRWPDDSVFSRDLIDLAMMRPALPLLRAAVTKAAGAYGDSILRDLGRAIERMQSRAGWLERCMQAMAMTDPSALVWQRIRALRRVLPDGAKDVRK
ncbi:MAG: nucleotidyl transferase AbiEii/AbiGii toxin family protein [Ramlibacter sp.]